jgi:NAD+-dependent protein deacetylase SIR2
MADVAREDGQPPAKRRRVEPKPRTTMSLNLGPDHSIDEQQPQLERLLKVLHKKRKIVVIAGAGISVSAGSMCPSTPSFLDRTTC